MEFVSCTDWDAFPESTNALFEVGGKDCIFFSRPWLNNLVRTAFEDDQFRLHTCIVEGDCVAYVCNDGRSPG